MLALTCGLLLLLGAHSVRIFADQWRTRTRASIGESVWKVLYSLISVVGLGLIVWGYGETRADSSVLWNSPVWTQHLASLLTLVAFVLLAAAYIPGTRIKAALGHPMVAGVKLWALAHLAANGRPGDVVLFGAFLLWAVLEFSSARRRDRAENRTYPPAPGITRDIIAIVVGLAAWAAFALYLHGWLIGVRPFA